MIIILNGDRFTFKILIDHPSIVSILWSNYKIWFFLLSLRQSFSNTIKISCFDECPSKQFCNLFCFQNNLHETHSRLLIDENRWFEVHIAFLSSIWSRSQGKSIWRGFRLNLRFRLTFFVNFEQLMEIYYKVR